MPDEGQVLTMRTARKGSRIAGVVVPIALAVLLLVPAQAVALDTASRSADQIRTRWTQLKPTYVGSPYAVAPSTVAPYAAGSLVSGFLQDGLNSVNYARYLAGLPDDVALDPSYVSSAQHGAVLLAASTLSHTPPKPADMDVNFYNIGLGATSKSNIGWGYGTLASFNNACMDDSDSSNIDRLGHRRWLLDPPLAKTGMGYAGSRSDTFVFDWSRVATVDYDSVKWPCEGLFPVEMFAPWTAWSVTLNPSKYSWNTSGQTVTLRRVADGRTWTFTSADTDKGGKYFNFERSGYGVNNCFVFRPDAATLGSYNAGDAFDVTVTGGIFVKSTGAPATVSYRTTFMSHAPPPAPDTTAPTTVSNAVATYTASASIKLTATDSNSGVAATYYRLDGGATQSGATVSVTTTGTHTLEFWSVDSAGNTETVDADNRAVFTVLPAPAAKWVPVHRFYNKKAGVHFYTISDAEKQYVVAHYGSVYTYEGIGYYINTASPENVIPLHRFYNNRTGVHFYTASESEKNYVLSRRDWPFVYEGIAYYVSSSPSGGQPVYRFYNFKQGAHFYTASAAERDNVKARYSYTFAEEGVAFYLAP